MNKTFFSLLGLLLVVAIALFLTNRFLTQTVKNGSPNKSQLGQLVDQVRTTTQQTEQAAAQRTNLDRNYYK